MLLLIDEKPTAWYDGDMITENVNKWNWVRSFLPVSIRYRFNDAAGADALCKIGVDIIT